MTSFDVLKIEYFEQAGVYVISLSDTTSSYPFKRAIGLGTWRDLYTLDKIEVGSNLHNFLNEAVDRYRIKKIVDRYMDGTLA